MITTTYLHRPTQRRATDATIVTGRTSDKRPWTGHLHAITIAQRVDMEWYELREVESDETAETDYNDTTGVATVTRVVVPPEPIPVSAELQAIYDNYTLLCTNAGFPYAMLRSELKPVLKDKLGKSKNKNDTAGAFECIDLLALAVEGDSLDREAQKLGGDLEAWILEQRNL